MRVQRRCRGVLPADTVAISPHLLRRHMSAKGAPRWLPQIPRSRTRRVSPLAMGLPEQPVCVLRLMPRSLPTQGLLAGIALWAKSEARSPHVGCCCVTRPSLVLRPTKPYGGPGCSAEKTFLRGGHASAAFWVRGERQWFGMISRPVGHDAVEMAQPSCRRCGWHLTGRHGSCPSRGEGDGLINPDVLADHGPVSYTNPRPPSPVLSYSV